MVFGFLKKAGRSIFNTVKRGASKIFRPIVRGARKVAKTVSAPLDVVNEGVKKMLSKIRSVPVLGEIASRGVSASRSHPILGKIIRALEGSSAGVDALEAFGKGNDAEAKRNLRKVAESAGGKTARRINQIVERIS